MSPQSAICLVRFGPFELNLATGELRKAGAKRPLQNQAFIVLATLLERPDELVSRAEFRMRLWPAGTFVDYEHGLNAAVRRLRETLGDIAASPRYIETLPRRGYRFIGPVHRTLAHSAGALRTKRTATSLTASVVTAIRRLIDVRRTWMQARRGAEPRFTIFQEGEDR